MADDFGWERGWSRATIELVETDATGTSRVSGDECPRCSAIVRTLNRDRHEVVCWGPDLTTQTAGQEYPTEYMITGKAVVGHTEHTAGIMVTREFLTDSQHGIRFALNALDRQIEEARNGLG